LRLVEGTCTDASCTASCGADEKVAGGVCGNGSAISLNGGAAMCAAVNGAAPASMTVLCAK
jgi:hypothetical protein